MRYRALIVLAVSGLLGFRFGMVAFPDWQVAVETAQVLAGVVHYSDTTPFFVYHMKLWTVLHQVLALLLRFGVSEIRLSLLLSGLLGMVSFQALAMFVFALSQDVLLAIGAPLLLGVTRATDFGVVYPIYLMGASHTYGIIGLSLIVLIVGLLGAGCYRSGAFLLGLAPAVHPSLGFWLLVIVAIAFVWDVRHLRDVSDRAGVYFVAGCIATGMSLALQRLSVYHTPTIPPALQTRYLSAFFSLWDVHRQPVPMALDGVSLNRGALTLALVWLIAFKPDLPRSALFLLRVVIVAAVLSLIMVVVSWIPVDDLPTSLLVLMPTRIANFNAMTFVALLLGLVGAYRARVWGALLALVLSLGLLLGERSMLWAWWAERGKRPALAGLAPWFEVHNVLETASVALIVLAFWTWNRNRRSTLPPAPNPPPLYRRTVQVIRFALVAVCIAIGIAGWRRSAPTLLTFEDYTNNPVFRVASEGSGLLLTGGNLHLVQLRTRRPVLLDGGGLDGLAYAPDSGPEVERILRDVYGIDFFNPPAEALRGGVIPSDFNQKVWEQYSAEQWRAIGYFYRVNEVMTYAGWSLHLPVIAQDRTLRLYQIPN